MFTITTRLSYCIVAVSQGIPTVVLSLLHRESRAEYCRCFIGNPDHDNSFYWSIAWPAGWPAAVTQHGQLPVTKIQLYWSPGPGTYPGFFQGGHLILQCWKQHNLESISIALGDSIVACCAMRLHVSACMWVHADAVLSRCTQVDIEFSGHTTWHT